MKAQEIQKLMDEHTKDGVLNQATFNDALNEAINSEIKKVVSKDVEKLSSKQLSDLFSEFGVSNKDELKSKLEAKAKEDNKDKSNEDPKVDVEKLIEDALEKQKKEFNTQLENDKKLSAAKSQLKKLGIDENKLDKAMRFVDIEKINDEDYLNDLVEKEIPEFKSDLSFGNGSSDNKTPIDNTEREEEVARLMRGKN